MDHKQRFAAKVVDSKNVTFGGIYAHGPDGLLESENSENVTVGVGYLVSPQSGKNANESIERPWYNRPMWKWAFTVASATIAGLAVWLISSAFS
jgi:hypothetical protein